MSTGKPAASNSARWFSHQLLEVIGADLERAGTAQRLRRDDATFGQQLRIGAEDQFLHGLVVRRRPIDGLVTAWRHRFETCFFRDFDCIEQRDFSVVVEIDANTQINLDRTGVGVEEFVKSDDRVTRSHLYGGEY